MYFQKPFVSFIELEAVCITTASVRKAGIAFCTVNGGDQAMTLQSLCDDMAPYFNNLSPAAYCASDDEDPKMAGENPDGAAKILSVSPADAVSVPSSPSATNAPVRSAPHFNNDLFN